jgi:serine/threonine-protein kinase
MSPEQCRGISGEVDHRTDVYALGIILYEMLCGAPPFVGEGFGDILVQHLTRPPDPPRSRNPSIPVPLERVILRALAKTAAQRYLTMADLQAALEGRPVPEPEAPPAPVVQTLPPTTQLPTPSVPFVRATTTLSANAGEIESSESESVPRSRRPMFVGLGAVAAAAIAAIFALRAPSAPTGGRAAAGETPPAVVVPPPPRLEPDAGVAVVAPATVKKTPRRSTVPKPKPAVQPSSDGMGKW